MDVEGVSAQLAQVAARAKARERELSEAEERGKEEERRALEAVVEAQVEVTEDEDPPEKSLGGEEQVEDSVEVPSSPGLNPDAAAFVPSFSFAPAPALVADKVEEENLAVEETVEEPAVEAEGYAVEEAEAAPQVEVPHADAPLSRSWAEVVVNGNGNAEEVESKVCSPSPPSSRADSISSPTRSPRLPLRQRSNSL